MLRYLTAGESHGRALVALVDGFPAGVDLKVEAINAELVRRQGGYGRGGRQTIETDHVEVLSGVWRGVTLGSPIALLIPNKDFKIDQMEDLDRPRPGHGDLSGSIKYLTSVRAILERASARETTTRVAAGALAKQLLAPLGITAFAYVVQVGELPIPPKPGEIEEQRAWRDRSITSTLDPDRDPQVAELIDRCKQAGDTLGGIVEIRVEGLPYGLGTHTQWDKKLDGRLAQAVMAVQAMKGVEIGMGFQAARTPGSQVHDPIQFDPNKTHTRSLGFTRTHNNAGGLEAGMTNSQPLVLRVAMKPISTLAKPLESVNLQTKQSESASYERSDVCAVAAASCILENVVAFEIACAVVEKFGGDNLEEIKQRLDLFYEMARKMLNE
ncbi:MAG: chorismate synthase [Planctomycetota bacterium]